MKKIIAISMITLLAACGSMHALKPGDTPAADSAVFIARVELNPMINDDWGQADKGDDPMTFAMAFTPGDGTNIKAWDDDVDFEYTNLDTNKFFAVEVKSGQQLAIRSLAFYARHKPFWLSNTTYEYNTILANPSYAIGTTPQAGNVYYLGTIKIDLADKSFKETGDEEYKRDKFQFVVPKNIKIADETADAKKWFAETHPKIGGIVRNVDLTMKDSGKDNTFKETQTTTTRY